MHSHTQLRACVTRDPLHGGLSADRPSACCARPIRPSPSVRCMCTSPRLRSSGGYSRKAEIKAEKQAQKESQKERRRQLAQRAAT
eukprot:2498641-Pleurochrysis_carterae.AAC.1